VCFSHYVTLHIHHLNSTLLDHSVNQLQGCGILVFCGTLTAALKIWDSDSDFGRKNHTPTPTLGVIV